MINMSNKTRFITTAAIIAALYAALTYASYPFAYYGVQFRISEVLTVLPFFTPAAIPGLFIGCIFGNITSPLGVIDIAVGSAASLIAACISRKMPKKWLVPLPPVIINAVFVSVELYYIIKVPLLLTMLQVAIGEIVVCYGGGLPLLILLEKHGKRIFGNARVKAKAR